MWLKLLFAVVSVLVHIDSPPPDNTDQPLLPPRPLDSNPEPINYGDALNLHLMIASHTDAGWIHTFERYYQGTHSQDGGCVKCILDNLMGSLPKDKARKYDMSEIAFFKRWWSDQSQEQKNNFKTLLQNRQFEFINGAWAANDEATAYYEDIMDNFILGHRWLQDNLDVDPLIGWQVDSFGNSATHAALMAQAGYEGLFFSRADYVDRETRRNQKSLQFNWTPPNPHNESVFTQMLYVTYSDTKFMVSDNFNCRSIFCNGNLSLSQYNQVVEYAKKQQKAFKTNNILWLVCDDFLLWQESEKDYLGAEAMIKHFNDHPELRINAKFSHLSDYLHQVQEDLMRLRPNVTIPVKHDDTFPYVEKRGHVWTGYFTSKSMFKLLVREYSEYYNAVKLLLAKIMLTNKTDSWDKTRHDIVNQHLFALEEPLAIVQHHDAVSGTMKQSVKLDYENMLNQERTVLENTIQPFFVEYFRDKIDEELKPYPVKYDWLYQDATYDIIFEPGSTTTFVAFNPGQARDLIIRIKVSKVAYSIVNETNQPVDTDTICHSEDTNNECFIYFVDNFAAYSIKVYKVIESTKTQKLTSEQTDNKDRTINAERLTLNVNRDLQNFEYSYCQSDDVCLTDSFNLDYKYYESKKQGDAAPSGAYVFNPISSEKKEYSVVKSGRIYHGKYFVLLQIFRDNLRTDIYAFKHQPQRGLEITTHLEPLNPRPDGKEVVLLVKSTSIKNGNTIFYTDTNGYYMQKRQKDHKDNFELDTANGINVNYYPLTSNMYIEDENSSHRLSVVTDRAQGGTSLNPGEIEIMIHRVTINDDWKGVNEPLQEKDSHGQFIKVTTRHFLSYSHPPQGFKDQRRQQQYDLDRPAQLWFYSSTNTEFNGVVNNTEPTKAAVPAMVKLYVRSYELNEYIIRLHNLDETSSKKVQIFDSDSKASNLLQQLAGKDGIKVGSVTELSWMTTRDRADVLQNEMDPNEPIVNHSDDKAGYASISLLPMEIRTFSIKVAT